jgi:stage II sporulation protein E
MFIIVSNIVHIKLEVFYCALYAGLGAALSGLILTYIGQREAIYYFYALIEGILGFIFTFVFQIGMSKFTALFDGEKHTISEVASISIVISLISVGTFIYTPVQINISYMLFSFSILACVSYFNEGEGMLLALTYGLLSMVAGHGTLSDISLIMLCTMAAFLVKSFEKIVIGIVYLSATTLSFYLYYKVGNTFYSALFGAGLGTLLFLIVSSRFLDKLNMKSRLLMSRATLSGQAANRILQNEIELQKSMIKEISKNMADDVSPDKLNHPKEVSKLLAADLCMFCPKYSVCWGSSAETTYEAIKMVCDAYEKNIALEPSELPKAFTEVCIYSPLLFRVICSLSDSIKVKQLNKAQNNRFKRLVREQFNHLSRVLDKIYLQLSKGLYVDPEESSHALSGLQNAGIAVDSMIIMEDFNKRRKVFITSQAPLSVEDAKTHVPKFLSELLRTNIAYDYEPNSSSKEYSYCYCEDYKYKLVVGAKNCVKDDYEASGDTLSSVILSSGYHMLALCDGMGSGKLANRQSSRVLNMFEELLNSGFDENSATQIVNSILVLEDGEEIFVTLDLFLFDLDKGLGEFVKAGAAATYVRRNDEIIKLEMETLPLGILEETHIKKSTRAFQRGDYLYFMSDGFFDSFKNEESLIRKHILKYDYRNPQKIADSLFEDALSITGGEAIDDITVVVARIR